MINNLVTLRNIFLNDMFIKGKINEGYWKLKAEEDPYLRKACFTVDLIFGNGKRYRIATKSITVYEDDIAIHYSPLLLESPSIDNSYDFKGGTASQRSINISCDARMLDPMAMVLGGSMLCGVGEISIQIDGEKYEDRYVFIRGDMTGGIEFGADKEQIDITISDPRNSVDKIIPEAFTTKQGFPNLPDDQIGLRFPLAITGCRLIPCIKLDNNNYGPTFLVVHGHSYNIGAVYLEGQEVEVESAIATGGSPEPIIVSNWTQIYGQDELGQPYTAVTFQNQNTPAFEKANVYASVYPIQGNAKTISEIIKHLITTYSLLGINGYDFLLHGRSVAKEGGLLRGEILINGSSQNNIATCLSYIDQSICNDYPMFKGTYTGRGFGIIYTDRKAINNVAHFIRGQGLLFDRVGVVAESDTEDLFNSFTLRYNYNALTDNFMNTVTRNQNNSNLCLISQSRIGLREHSILDSVLIKDDITANAVIEWYVNHYTLPSYTVTYIGSAKLFFMVQLGDNVQITDDKLGIEKQKATIVGLNYSKGLLEIQFLLWIGYYNQ